MHEVDLNKYQIRTDLTIDEVKNKKDLKGVTENKKTINGIDIYKVILDDNNSLNRKKGNYVTISFKDITDSTNAKKVSDIFSNQLKLFIGDIDDQDLVLIVGLGNIKSTPDALGPKVLDSIVVTNHLYILGQLGDNFKRVAAIKPGVMGTTGIESKNIIKSIISKEKPKLVIVIDSLASSSLDHVNTTIQITDTGIHPGSGIGNSRDELNFETLGVNVIAIGVPTVVDATTIVTDTIEYLYHHYAFNKKISGSPLEKLVIPNVNYLNTISEISDYDKKNLLGMIGTLNKEETHKLIDDVLNPIGFNLMVTPTEIDFIVDRLAHVIASGINNCLHQALNLIDNTL